MTAYFLDTDRYTFKKIEDVKQMVATMEMCKGRPTGFWVLYDGNGTMYQLKRRRYKFDRMIEE